ncbi:hypothetical protein F0562_022066 [Nyssa sinensis]|uniref:C2H2-type domain-containing protein n=1 Tax=Nyssa sinensis TaxID=561372 RepID=A0A5J5BPN1_9ASTE|nr:hypothetical protein F0562_022066 [Nyssa sinensis]
MTSLRPFFINFLSLFLLLIHLGCFVFTSNGHRHQSKRRKVTPLSPSSQLSSRLKLKTHKALSSSWCFLKRIFTSKLTHNTQTHPNSAIPSSNSARSSQQSFIVSLLSPETTIYDTLRKRPAGSPPESDISADQHFFPLRNDIYPCPACGEIFQKPNLLEQHQAIKHAVSELIDGDSGKNIVRIIFETGWADKAKSPNIRRILKIHNSPKILTRFEEYRESVKLKAARNGAVRRRDERCIADGNELLRCGFSPKMDGICTLSTSWRAHAAIPDEIEEEFKFMNVKRAMLVCRVIAGRVGCDQEVVDKEDPGFESAACRDDGGAHTRLDEEDELLVFSPRAVLPCFVIVYTV